MKNVTADHDAPETYHALYASAGSPPPASDPQEAD